MENEVKNEVEVETTEEKNVEVENETVEETKKVETKEITETPKEEVSKKRKGRGPLYWIIVIVGVALIVYLSIGIGEKLGKLATTESGNGTTKEESNSNPGSNVEESNNNNQSNVVDTSNSNISSNSNTNKTLTYSIEMSTIENNKDTAIVRAKDNDNVAWEYKTSSYEKTELETFKLYEGNTYVYVAEAGIVKALDKTTGNVVWTSSSNVGQSTDMLEVNGKLYAVGSYQKGLSILNVSNGTLDKEVSINTYTKPEKLNKVSADVISFQAGEVVNGTLITVTFEYNITTGQLTKK